MNLNSKSNNKNNSNKDISFAAFRHISCHGVPYLYRYRSSVVHRIIWLNVLILALGGMAYACYQIMIEFIEDPTSTLITVDFRTRAPAPDILLCHSAVLNKTFLESQNISFELAHYVQHVFMGASGGFNPTYALNRSNELEFEYQELVARYPRGDVRQFFYEAGFQCQSSLVSCVFDGNQFDCCNESKQMFDFEHGNCYWFQGNRFEQIWASLGYVIHASIDSKTFFPFSDMDSLGLSMKILPHYHPGIPGQILIPAGYRTIIELQTQQFEHINTRLKAPQCIQNDLNVKTVLGTFPNKEICQWNCLHESVLKRCNCSYAAAVDTFLVNNTVQYYEICSPAKIMSCLKGVDENETNSHCAKQCLPLCSRLEYLKTISFAPLVNSVSMKRGSPMDAVVDIHFKNFEILHMEEVESLTPVSVIASIGGVMGVFLGSSLVTVIEFLFICINTMWNYLTKDTKSIQPVSS